MAGRRGYEDEQLEDSETGSDYPWNQWYGYPPYGYYPYGAARMSPHSQWSRAQCGSQSAMSNPEDNDASEIDSEDEDIDAPASSQKRYVYRLKIINPNKKSDFIIRDVHHFVGKFATILDMKKKLMEEFKDELPETTDFKVGYFYGKQSAKRWIVTQEDLDAMYKIGKDKLLLWADARITAVDGATVVGQKRKCSDSCSFVNKRQQIEAEVDSTVAELKEKQGDKYSLPQLRLWARSIISGNHDSTEEPPDLPVITGVGIKKQKKQTLSEALVEAATTFAGAVRGPDIRQTGGSNATVTVLSGSTAAQTPTKVVSESERSVGLSPGRVTELRSKKLQELKDLQCLLDQGILTEEEFAEQKALVLASLRKLTH